MRTIFPGLLFFSRPNVHIEDVAALFLNVLDLALGDDGGHHGRNGYFIAENGEHTL
jgi:hypothetical protein